MLLPPKFQEETLKTLGPPIRKDEEKKPVEEHIGNNVWRVNGKLETRIPENEHQFPPIPFQGAATTKPYQSRCVHKNWSQNQDACMDCGITGLEVLQRQSVDIPLPDVSEFKPVWRRSRPTKLGAKMAVNGILCNCTVCADHIAEWHLNNLWEWLDEGR